MVPPGVPDFPAGTGSLPGRLRARGPGLVGFAPVVAVEVSTDGGETWAEAELDEGRVAVGLARLAVPVGRVPGHPRAPVPRLGHRWERPARRAGVERQRLREQRGAACPSRSRD